MPKQITDQEIITLLEERENLLDEKDLLHGRHQKVVNRIVEINFIMEENGCRNYQHFQRGINFIPQDTPTMRTLTPDQLQVLQAERKEYHRKKRKRMKVFLRKKPEIIIVEEVIEDTPQETVTVDDIIFFDGDSIAEIKMLFTKNGCLREFGTVVRELKLMAKIKLPNKGEGYSQKIGRGRREILQMRKIAAAEIPLVIKRERKQNVVPEKRGYQRFPHFEPDPPTSFTRPPAIYSNRSQEEIINQYLKAQ